MSDIVTDTFSDNRKQILRRNFFGWLNSVGCAITFNRSRSESKTVDITLMKNGQPWTTVCYETFPKNLSDVECEQEIIDRLVGDRLRIGFFERLGLSDVNSYEELELKLSVLNG